VRKILVTGYTGFIGNELLNNLLEIPESSLIGIARREVFHWGLEKYYAVDLCEETDLSSYLEGVETIIHTAGMAHASSSEKRETPLDQFLKVNVDSTIHLARQALLSGTKRFIFISSIGVNGATSKSAFTENDKEYPYDSYTKSKLMAEIKLKALTKDSEMDLVIIRPPLVYGQGAPGTFRQLVNICRTKVPLPFAMVQNKRSMIYIENLVDFIVRCIDHPLVGNQTFLVSDGQDLSLCELVRTIRNVMNRPSWLLPVPVWVFKLAGRLTGKTAMVDRLVGDLQVDSSKAQQLLGWTPPYTVEQGMKATVTDFNNRK